MKKSFAITILSSALYVNAATYNISNQESNSYFKAMSDVVFFGSDEIIGINKKLTGTLTYENNKIENGEIIIFTSGFNTQNSMRDKHIQEILTTQKHSKISFFIQKQFEKNSQQFIQGILKINDIEKSQTIPVQIKLSGNILLLQGKFNIKYKDFDIEKPTFGGFIKRANETIEIGGKFIFEQDNK